MPVINPPENRANERVENIQPAVAIETLVLIQGRITFLTTQQKWPIHDASLFARLGSIGPKRPIAIPLAIFIKITPTSRATSFFLIFFSKLKFEGSTNNKKQGVLESFFTFGVIFVADILSTPVWNFWLRNKYRKALCSEVSEMNFVQGGFKVRTVFWRHYFFSSDRKLFQRELTPSGVNAGSGSSGNMLIIEDIIGLSKTRNAQTAI